MAVGVGKIDGLRWHPVVRDRASHFHTLLPEGFRSSLDIGFSNGEGDVLRRPLTFIFLEHHHAVLATGP